MSRRVIIVIVVVLLMASFVGATYASFTSYGVIASGAPFARSGSVGGVVVMDGGPGNGK